MANPVRFPTGRRVKKVKNEPQHCDSKVDERVWCEKNDKWSANRSIVHPSSDGTLPFCLVWLSSKFSDSLWYGTPLGRKSIPEKKLKIQPAYPELLRLIPIKWFLQSLWHQQLRFPSFPILNDTGSNRRSSITHGHNYDNYNDNTEWLDTRHSKWPALWSKCNKPMNFRPDCGDQGVKTQASREGSVAGGSVEQDLKDMMQCDGCLALLGIAMQQQCSHWSYCWI